MKQVRKSLKITKTKTKKNAKQSKRLKTNKNFEKPINNHKKQQTLWKTIKNYENKKTYPGWRNMIKMLSDCSQIDLGLLPDGS